METVWAAETEEAAAKRCVAGWGGEENRRRCGVVSKEKAMVR